MKELSEIYKIDNTKCPKCNEDCCVFIYWQNLLLMCKGCFKEMIYLMFQEGIEEREV